MPSGLLSIIGPHLSSGKHLEPISTNGEGAGCAGTEGTPAQIPISKTSSQFEIMKLENTTPPLFEFTLAVVVTFDLMTVRLSTNATGMM